MDNLRGLTEPEFIDERYQIDPPAIHDGEHTIVFSGFDLNADRKIAVKFVSDKLTNEQRKRFDREYATPGRWSDHPELLHPYDSGTWKGHPFIVLPWMPQTLRHRLQEEAPFAPLVAASISRDIARAVALLHGSKADDNSDVVVHCDLKPENVFFDASGRLQVGDFGVVRELEFPTLELPYLMGTPGYAAPEQIDGRLKITTATDVFALGVILYELLIGQRPFVSSVVDEVLRKIQEDDPIPPRRVIPSTPKSLEAICLQCLRKKPESRYPNARELADDLDRFLEGRVVEARPEPMWSRIYRWAKRNRWIAAVLVLIAILLTVLVVSFLRERWLRADAETGYSLARENAKEASENATEAREQTAIAQREQRKAEMERYRAEVRGLQYQTELALRDVQPEYRNSAVLQVPPSERLGSWDTRYIASMKQARATCLQKTVSGDWGVTALALSPDRRQFVSADAGGRIVLADKTTGWVLQVLREGQFSETLHRDWHGLENREVECFLSACWTPTGVALASSHGRAVMLDPTSGTMQTSFTTDEPLVTVAASGQGELLYGGAFGTLTLCDSTTGTVRNRQLGESAITAILWDPVAKNWIIGRADGTVEIRHAATLERLYEKSFPGPIWSLALFDNADESSLVVGCQSSDIFELDRQTLETVMRYHAQAVDTEAEALHAVTITDQDIFAVDQAGCLYGWKQGRSQVEWFEDKVVWPPDPRTRTWRHKADEPLLAPFVKTASALHWNADLRELTIAGLDGAVAVWHIESTSGNLPIRVTDSFGRIPRITFDRRTAHRLWVLSADGQLQLVDVQKQTVLDTASAHKGRAASIAPVPRGALTVGGDHSIRSWTIRNDRIVAVPKETLAAPAGSVLVGIATTTDGRWVAAVTADCQLMLWNRNTRKRHATLELAHRKGIAPGSIVFSANDQRLAIAVPGQSLPAFAFNSLTGELTSLPDQALIGGHGATAVAWNPVRPTQIIAADDHPRLTARTYADHTNSSGETGPEPELQPQSTGIALAATADGRRIVLLEKSGQIDFLESTCLAPVLELRSHLGSVSDLAFDPTGRWMAVSDQDGELEIWDAGATAMQQLTPKINVANQWETTVLTPLGPDAWDFRPEAVRVDTSGRIHLIAVENRVDDFRHEGQPFYLCLEGNELLKEPISIDATLLDRRCDADSTALHVGSNGDISCVLRRRLARHSSDDGEVYLAHRDTTGRWSVQTIVSGGNSGFYPFIRNDEENSMQEVFHFDFSSKCLQRTFSTDAKNQDWETQTIGRQGDGYQLQGSAGAGQTTEFVFQRNRFNSERSPFFYARWDGEQLHRSIVGPSALPAGPLTRLPDHSLLVSTKRHQLQLKRRQQVLLRYDGSRWIEERTLPLLTDIRPLYYGLASDGSPLYLSWDSVERQLVLWTANDTWSAEIIADDLPGNPIEWKITTDNHGHPPIVIGCTREPDGWIAVIRKK